MTDVSYLSLWKNAWLVEYTHFGMLINILSETVEERRISKSINYKQSTVG